MPPTRREKLQAHAEHLLDAFLGLRGTFAMLEPILFERSVVELWGAGKRAQGLHVLTTALFQSCVLAIAKITRDNDERSPSVMKLVTALDADSLAAELREAFAIWNLAPISDYDSNVLALLQTAERREEQKRRIEFDALVQDLRSGWASLGVSPAMKSFGVIRDKLIAHNELWHDGLTYRPLDISTLGLKWSDLRAVINDLQTLIAQITLVYRNTSFAFDALDKQLAAAKTQFWSPTQ
jgi:hypothetical protein